MTADPSTPHDGARIVFMGAKGDTANGSVGQLRLMIEWEDGDVEPFDGFMVDEYVPTTATWIVSR